MRRRVGMVVAAAIAAVLAVAGCGEEKESGEEAAADPVRVVVIGNVPADEPARSDPCPGCDPWWAQFTDHVSSELGTEATYDVVSVDGVPEALDAVSQPGPEADKVAAADVVVISVGANNALPDPETGIGCKAWFLDAHGPCLAEGVKTYGDLYDQVYAAVKALRDDKPTVYVQTTSTNGNISPPSEVSDGLLSLYTDAGREDEAKAWAVAAYDRWSTMQTERATAAGFQVIDTYHALNGPDGTEDLVPEFNKDDHFNAAGHDRFAAQLADVDLSVLSDR
ncbi:SGNH/GDSL hydrolase family protein [Nocardioides sp. NPDC126508]